MARTIDILSITTSSGVTPGSFVIGASVDNSSANWTSVFKGRFYRDSAYPTANESPFYNANGALATQPAGYQLIEATTFEVINNPSYNGRYTVYTQKGTTSDAANPSTTFTNSPPNSNTRIRVNENIGTPTDSAHLNGTGQITNISTYYLLVAGESPLVVPPAANVAARPIEFVGRNFSGWGEIIQQNIIEAVQHYASNTAPSLPFRGQMWFDTSAVPNLMKVWDGSAWATLNAGAFAPANSYRHTQTTASSTWTVNHNLGAASPFIVHHTFFVDTGGGVIKPIIPADVSYVSAGQFTVTFTANYTGYALVRL